MATDVQPRAGRLLVATPALADGPFAASVVLLLGHDDAGTLGVVLNRPGHVPVADVAPGWERAVTGPAVVFVGGPVQQNAVLALGRSGDPVVADVEVGLVDLAGAPAEDSRLFRGYAGWGPGQLDGELEAGAWFVVQAAPGDPLTARPEALWRAVLTRRGGLFVTAVEDPSLN